MIRAAVARSYGLSVAEAASRKNFPDCSRCQQPDLRDSLREFWGCDEDSSHPVWESTCQRCAGSDPSCLLCDGSNRVHHSRCPQAIVNGGSPQLRLQLDLLMRAYRHFDQHGVFPVAGAYLDQSRSFMSAVDVIDSEKAYWEAELRDEQRRKMEAQERKANASRGRR